MTQRVSATTFTTPSDREIVIKRVVDAPRRLVFEAWTNPEHLPHATASYVASDATQE